MSRWHLVWLSAAALFLTACEQKQAQPQAHTEDPNATMAPLDAPERDPFATDPGAAQPRATTARPTYTPSEPAPSEERVTSSPPRERRSAPKAAATGRTYTVKTGDTLEKIAKQHYGDGSQWKRIYEANRNVLSNPNKIKPGMKLRIP